MRWRLGLICIVLMLIALIITAPVTGQSPSVSQRNLEEEIIAKINSWRTEEGLWPLHENDTLRAMAFDQASFLLTTNVPYEGGDFHRDTNGLYPRGRGGINPYNWPTYGSPQEILVGENAAVGNVKFAINYWENSPIHHQTVVNPDYREIGVAAIQTNGTDVVFIAVFGGRPNVLPVEFNPVDRTVYLSNDYSKYATRYPKWISNANTIQFLDANAQPLRDPQPWQLIIPILDNMPNNFIVRFSNGTVQVDTSVDMGKDVEVEIVGGEVLDANNANTVVDSAEIHDTAQIIAPTNEAAQADVLAQYPNHNQQVAAELLAQINALRLKHTIWPLAQNSTLTALALKQANYLLTETIIDEVMDLHADADSLTIHERATEAPFFWPRYGSENEVVIEENIAIGDVAFAMRFWKQSAQDLVNMVNLEYREVGIAALPYQNGEYVLVAVFGSRPNVLPAFFDTAHNTLLLSDEATAYAGLEKGFIGPVTRIRLFDGAGRPLIDGWLAWHEAIQLPAMDTDRLFILFSDGRIDILAEVDLRVNTVVLPDNASSAVVLESAAPPAAATPVPAVANTIAFPTNTPAAP